MWIAQGLEHDIVAQGRSIEQAKHAFEATLWGRLQLATQHDLSALASVPPAPAMFWEIWDRANAATIQAERMPSIPAYMMPVVTHDTVPA
jgi:hypothetical protein